MFTIEIIPCFITIENRNIPAKARGVGGEPESESLAPGSNYIFSIHRPSGVTACYLRKGKMRAVVESRAVYIGLPFLVRGQRGRA